MKGIQFKFNKKSRNSLSILHKNIRGQFFKSRGGAVLKVHTRNTHDNTSCMIQTLSVVLHDFTVILISFTRIVFSYLIYYESVLNPFLRTEMLKYSKAVAQSYLNSSL